MPKLTTEQILHFNRRVPGLGTVLQGLEAGYNSMKDYFDGTINTGNALVDNCDAVNMSTVDNAALFNPVSDTVTFFKGTGSVKLEALTATATGMKIYKIITSANWGGSNKIGFIAQSDIALAAGDVKFYIKDNVAGDQYVSLPALSAGVPKYVELDISALTLTAVVRYGFQCNKAAIFNVNIDNIVQYQSANSVVLSQTPVLGDSVRISTLLKAATATHTRAALVEDTDFAVIYDSKRIIFLTNQSGNSCECDYKV
jgi:hypothetical protein